MSKIFSIRSLAGGNYAGGMFRWTESKEAADTAMEDKPVVRLAFRNFPRM